MILRIVGDYDHAFSVMEYIRRRKIQYLRYENIRACLRGHTTRKSVRQWRTFILKWEKRPYRGFRELLLYFPRDLRFDREPSRLIFRFQHGCRLGSFFVDQSLFKSEERNECSDTKYGRESSGIYRKWNFFTLIWSKLYLDKTNAGPSENVKCTEKKELSTAMWIRCEQNRLNDVFSHITFQIYTFIIHISTSLSTDSGFFYSEIFIQMGKNREIGEDYSQIFIWHFLIAKKNNASVPEKFDSVKLW